MAAIDFPSSPSDGQQVTVTVDGNDIVYEYDSTKGRWKITSAGVTGPTVQTGSDGATGQKGQKGAAGTSSIPQSTNTTAVSSDAGKFLNVSSGVTINSSTGFSVGDAVTIFNSSSGNITITAVGITLYNAGTASTGNRILAQKGLATILCVGSNTYTIGGAGVS